MPNKLTQLQQSNDAECCTPLEPWLETSVEKEATNRMPHEHGAVKPVIMEQCRPIDPHQYTDAHKSEKNGSTTPVQHRCLQVILILRRMAYCFYTIRCMLCGHQGASKAETKATEMARAAETPRVGRYRRRGRGRRRVRRKILCPRRALGRFLPRRRGEC